MFSIDFFSQPAGEIVSSATEKLKDNPEEWEKNIWQFILDWFNPAITGIKVFTSGTTGAPVQIEHTKEAMLHSAKMTCEALNLKPGNNVLLCLPADKISGMMMMVRSIYNQMNLYCIRPSATSLSEIYDVWKIDFAAFTAMQFGEILRNPLSFEKAENIRKVILGGEAVRTLLAEKIRLMNNDVYATFGMTETISHIALKKISGGNPDRHFKILPHIRISTDEQDCLIVKAPELGQSHLVTHDVVSIISPGEFEWLGRIDDVINSGGVKIFPEEIEEMLLPYLHLPFFIGALSDPFTGEKVVLVIETDIISNTQTDQVKRALRKLLDKNQQPKGFVLLSKFKRTETGKIKRKESLQGVTKIMEF